MLDYLLTLIREKTPITEADVQLCESYFEPVVCSRNRVLEEAGKIPAYLYFVTSGYVRLFYVGEDGNEVTTHINCPPGFITSYFSYLHQTPAKETVQCLTDCELVRITKHNLDALFQASDNLKNFGISVFQQSLAYNEARAHDLATLSAAQRYQKLLARNPGIIHNIPVQIIASFLGMKPESLSRIRRQLIS